MNSIDQLQPAIIAKLKGDPGLTEAVKGVFDKVKQGQPFPYIHISNPTETPNNTFGRKGRNATITVNVYSQANGSKEALQIYSKVDALLDGNPLNLKSFHLVYLQNGGMEGVTLAPDGVTWLLPISYEAFIQE